MAFSLMERLREVDPLDAMNSNPQVYLLDGKYELALEFSRRMYEADSESPIAQAAYALTLAYNKKFKEAILIIDKAAEATPDNAVTKLVLLLKYGLLKDDEKAFLLLTSDFYKTCRRDLLWSYFVATDLSLLDAREEALDWMENAIKRGFINYPFLQCDPFLDNIRGEERFKKLMERAKYEWEHFEVSE